MKNSAWLGLVVGGLLWTASASAQVPCLGDCNGDGRVAINELIIGVNIALNVSPASACPAFDPDGNGSVVISDLVTAVNNALNGCPGTPTPTRTIGSPTITSTPTATVPTPTATATSAAARCGNRVVEPGESCDDGNNVGGDGCAANCTTEDLRVSVFDPLKSSATVQNDGLPALVISCKPATNPDSPTCLRGQQTLRTGKLRNEAVFDKNGNLLFEPGQIPVALRADEVFFNPIVVTGVGCACTRAVPIPAFGQNVSGSGIVGCGDTSLSDVNYEVVQDHNTNPGSPGNRVQAMPNDPECNDQTDLDGAISEACLEGTGSDCSTPEHSIVHPAVCNSPPALTRSGGPAPKGSAFIVTGIQIGVLLSGGFGCPAMNCRVTDFGPDCMPCTDDDVVKGAPATVALTTGVAQGAVFDVNNATSGLPAIEEGVDCGFGPCVVKQVGQKLDCSLIVNDPTYAGTGSKTVLAFPALDSRGLGDNVTSVILTPK